MDIVSMRRCSESVIIDGRQWTPESNGKTVRWPEANQFCDSLELRAQRLGRTFY